MGFLLAEDLTLQASRYSEHPETDAMALARLSTEGEEPHIKLQARTPKHELIKRGLQTSEALSAKPVTDKNEAVN